jgi:large subunit ribosomal protein L26e
MKFSKNVSFARRKNRKKFFSSNSNERRKLMSSPVSKNLKNQYEVSY